MEMVEGRTARSLVAERPPIDDVVAIGSQVARALELAHRVGIVHRDIKPDNLMVRPDGVVKVLDFGLARPASGALASGVTVSFVTGGAIVGTAAYMSPEQARGLDVDAATDIFALGATLYELLARRHPFVAADLVSTLARVLSDAPAPPSNWNPDVPAPLERLILDMLSKDRRRRPSASDVLQRLTAIGSPAPPGIPSAARGPRRMVGQDRAMAELLEAFREADAGRGVMVAISGEAGVGKTTLADAFTRLAEAREHLERGAAL